MKNINKIFSILLTISMLFCLCSCVASDTTEYETEEIETDSIIDFIHISNDGRLSFYYDRDTKVIYVIVHKGNSSGIGYAMSPLYNADGTLRTYNGE